MVATVKREPDRKRVLKEIFKSIDRGEFYDCDNFAIFAKVITNADNDFKYKTKFAVVYDEKLNRIIIGELGLCFIGQKNFRGEIVEYLYNENRLQDLWDPDTINNVNHLSIFLNQDEGVLSHCSELINKEYRDKIIERIKYNTEFLNELENLREDIDPSDPNFGVSYLTLETAITEITEKIEKLRNLLEFGDTDIIEPL